MLAGCTTTSSTPAPVAFSALGKPGCGSGLRRNHQRTVHKKVDAIDVADIDPKYLRKVVDFPTREPVGTIVVDPHERFVYLVQEHGKARSYGVGKAGKEGLEFTGTATIEYKKKWPH